MCPRAFRSHLLPNATVASTQAEKSELRLALLMADLAHVDLLERLEQSAASSSQMHMRVGDFER